MPRVHHTCYSLVGNSHITHVLRLYLHGCSSFIHVHGISMIWSVTYALLGLLYSYNKLLFVEGMFAWKLWSSSTLHLWYNYYSGSEISSKPRSPPPPQNSQHTHKYPIQCIVLKLRMKRLTWVTHKICLVYSTMKTGIIALHGYVSPRHKIKLIIDWLLQLINPQSWHYAK